MLAFWQMFSQCAQSAVLSIRLHLLRSGLTTLGIIIGVAAVISVVAIMQGLSAGIRGQLDDLGSDMTTLRAFTTPDQELLGFRNKLTDSDYEALLNKISDFEQITVAMPAYSMGLSVSYGRSNSQSQLIGAAPNYQHVIRIYPQLGRFILPQDDERRRRVAFIGPSLINKLQLPANPVGEFVLISGDWFRIIGVGEKRGSLFGFDQDNYIITPFQTAKALNGPDQLQVEISYRAKAGVDEQALQQQIRHPAGAARAEARAQALQQQEDELSRRLAQLDSASRRAGQLRWIAPERLVAGRIVSRGEVLGHVLAGDRLIARVAVPGDRVADLMRGVQAVEVLALEAPARPQAGRWDGVLPQTALRLPVRALGSSGGGAIEVDPADAEGLRTLAPVAVIDVEVPALAADRLGGRLKVRFDHGPRPLGGRLLEALQRLVLGRFGEAVDVPAGG